MKRLSFIFLIFLFAFSVIGQTINVVESKVKRDVPNGWKLVDLSLFSFLLPESMEDKKARGKDSQIWRFENGEMQFSIDSGWYKVDFDYDIEHFESETKWIEVDGVKGQFFAIDNTKRKTASNIKISKTEKAKPFLKAIVFYEGESSYSSFWVRYKNSEQKENAEKILQSIKFKK